MTANHNKQKTIFYVTFRNVPYTDSEWKNLNFHREQLNRTLIDFFRELRIEYKIPPYRLPLTKRPNHAFAYGESFFSEEEARKYCEMKILKNKAQLAEYIAIVVTSGSFVKKERWRFNRKTATWSKFNSSKNLQ